MTRHPASATVLNPLLPLPGGPAGLAKVTLVACGRNHTIVATGDGSLFGFGANGENELGSGSNDEVHSACRAPAATPERVPGCVLRSRTPAVPAVRASANDALCPDCPTTTTCAAAVLPAVAAAGHVLRASQSQDQAPKMASHRVRHRAQPGTHTRWHGVGQWPSMPFAPQHGKALAPIRTTLLCRVGS